jgi:hypothetical protein
MRKKADENAGKFEKNREMTRNEDQTSRERRRCISEKEKKSTNEAVGDRRDLNSYPRRGKFCEL